MATSTFVLRGRRGACSHQPSIFRVRHGPCRHRPWFCVAGVALMALGWIWWGAGSPLAARGAAALGDIDFRFAWQAWRLTSVLRGIRVTWRHRPWFCVVGVALVALGWIWWRAWSPLVAQSAAALCFGRRCACSHPCCFCVAGVALGDIALRFAWQAWRLVTSSFVLRGRHVTWRH